MGKIPDRWCEYKRIGKQIVGTRFICFKVPLSEAVNNHAKIVEDEQLYPALLPKLIPNLGMVIDLTNTSKYYHPKDILSLGLGYKKMNVIGHQVPSRRNYREFKKTVDKFLQENTDNEKLIGVHCTHGLNRTGYLVCRYLVEASGLPAFEAIARFEIARGHNIERKNYLDDIKEIETKRVDPIANDTEVDKGTQSPSGFWISKRSLPKHQRGDSSSDDNDSDSQTVSTQDQRPNHRISLRGYVNVQSTDLIPDGRGGYFVRVEQKDINSLPSLLEDKLRMPPRKNNMHPSSPGFQRMNGYVLPQNMYGDYRGTNYQDFSLPAGRFDNPRPQLRQQPYPRRKDVDHSANQPWKQNHASLSARSTSENLRGMKSRPPPPRRN